MSQNEQVLKCDQPEYSTLSQFLVIQVFRGGQNLERHPVQGIATNHSHFPQIFTFKEPPIFNNYFQL